MNKRIRSLLCAICVIIAICSNVITINAFSAISDLTLTTEDLANKYLHTTIYTDLQGNSIKRIENINTLKQRIITINKNFSDLEIARQLYKSIEDEDIVDNLPTDKLLEVLSFTESIQTTSYIEYTEDGIQNILSEAQVVSRLRGCDRLTKNGLEILNNKTIAKDNSIYTQKASNKSSVTTTSKNGYLKIVTSANKTTGSMSGRTYYIISAKAVWLKEPVWKLQDVFAIASNATYDNSYNNYGCFNEVCTESDSNGNKIATHTLNSKVYKKSGSNNNKISFIYDNGIGGIAIKFDMFEGKYSGSEAHHFDYSIKAYLRFKCSLYNTDGGIQAGYAHNKINISNIKISFKSGTISFSALGSVAKYYGETLSIYA